MDLTIPIGAAAILITVLTLFLIVREVAVAVWRVMPEWFRLTLVSFVAIAVVIALVR
jgi:hypothetical protein